MGVSRTVAVGLAAATLMAGTMAIAPRADAGSEGRRNTAAVLGGVAAYSLIKGDTRTGVAAGIGAAIAYERYRNARDDERHERWHRCSRCEARYRGDAHPCSFERYDDFRGEPPGWSRGRKVGWGGGRVPPGHRR